MTDFVGGGSSLHGIRSVITPPSGPLPILLPEAKLFVRDTTEANDDLIESLVRGGFAEAERQLDRAICQQTRRWNFGYEPERQIILEPYFEATLVIRRAVNGAWENLDTSKYTLSGYTGDIFAHQQDYYFPRVDGEWVGPWAYQVQTVCGWEDGKLPADIRIAILTYVKDMYDHRGIRDIGRPMSKPWDSLLSYSWRMGWGEGAGAGGEV